jgi:hypothetical protein
VLIYNITPLIYLVKFKHLKNGKNVQILIDSGATSIGFIDINYIKTEYLNLKGFN